MIWTDFDTIYQATMSNPYTPFFYKDNKLYIITSWSLGTVMVGATIDDGITNRAEGKELIDYGN
jgi:hypothetical protein